MGRLAHAPHMCSSHDQSACVPSSRHAHGFYRRPAESHASWGACIRGRGEHARGIHAEGYLTGLDSTRLDSTRLDSTRLDSTRLEVGARYGPSRGTTAPERDETVITRGTWGNRLTWDGHIFIAESTRASERGTRVTSVQSCEVGVDLVAGVMLR